MKYFKLHLIIIILLAAVGCSDEPQQETVDSQEQVDSEMKSGEDPFENTEDSQSLEATEQIKEILLTYYQDLSREAIQESDYFAPVVEKFYGQENRSREQVAKSIRNGFQSVENRSITLDENSLAVDIQENMYVATFNGKVAFTRTKDKSKVAESFRNKVTFDQDLKIIRYEGLAADQKEEKTAVKKPQVETSNRVSTKERSQTPLEVLLAFINSFKGDDLSLANNFIDADKGLFFITRPGAMDAVYHGNDIPKLLKKAYTPWVKGQLANTNCQWREEALPDFDCDDFSKEGCFISTINDYSRTSSLMKSLNKYDLGDYSSKDIENARKHESLVTHIALITEAPMAIFIGQVDGQWKVLGIDIATYDCSA